MIATIEKQAAPQADVSIGSIDMSAFEAQFQPAPPEYLLIDEIPDFAQERQVVRGSAEAILAERRDALRQGTQSAETLVPVDALSTAQKVLAAQKIYGTASAEHAELRNGLVLDCRRLLAEWYRKKRPEYFPESRHVFDAKSQEFFSYGLSIAQMTKNALVPMADDPEEEARRVNERVEDATPQIVRNLGGTALGMSIRTISECTDKAETDYAEDIKLGRKHRGYGGYVPEISKFMVRNIRLDTETNDRFEEQIALPGIFITHDIIVMALEQRGLSVGHMDKTALHGAQFLASDDPIDFVAHMDAVASEQWCTNIFMGEEVPQDFVKDYEGFRGEALQRQESLEGMAEIVATFVLDLARDNVDKQKALVMVEDFVKKQLLDLGKSDYEAAEQMFDTKTADGLQEVAYLESIGCYDAAFTLGQLVEAAAPGGGYCGAGSCGLENLSGSSEEGQALLDAVGAEDGDIVLKDMVRSCSCGHTGIIYAFNTEKVNKYCPGCKSFESSSSKTT